MDLPRISRSFRAHLSIAPVRQLKPTDVLKHRLTKSKQNNRVLLWKDIYRLVNESNPELSEKLKLLRSTTEELVGSEQPQEIVDDASVFLLRLFFNEHIVMLKHLSEMKQMFGKVTSAAANKICEIVVEISSQLSDKCRTIIEKNSLEVRNSTKEWGEGIPCNFSTSLSYQKDTSKLSNLTEKISATKDVIDNFSMKYNKTLDTTKANQAGSSKPIKNHNHNNNSAYHQKNSDDSTQYDRSWLDVQLQKYYISGNPSGVSSGEFLNSIITALQSTKSDIELQNDLFDLLGFDRFEFIQDVLQHRNSIVSGGLKTTNTDVADRPQPHYLSQVIVYSEQEKQQMKQMRKEGKKNAKISKNRDDDDDDEYEFNPAYLREKRISSLIAPANNVVSFPTTSTSFKFERQRVSAQKIAYPNVYDVQLESKLNAGFIGGAKIMLPETIERINTNIYEEVRIPLSDPAPIEVGKNLISISSLDEIGQSAFEGTKTLNRIQSVVFSTAYNTNENLLICAPTGAGKTNVAMLTIVHQIRQHIENNVIMINKFKIVYIAPMKALAAEMTANFGKKLSSLGIVVKELTGDMQLTKTEIHQTQMIVTTPEKWDVVTRKGTGDVALTSLVRLLIIDEVHLLHGDRGPVIETLVARTLRQVESSQSMIRIVGLSATLPNYLDVARFLRVNPHIGLFFFDSRFRPVPLSQTFIGIKNSKPLQQMSDMDAVCYDKVYDMVQKGHQVMVFVHARNATNRTAMVLKEMAQNKGQIQSFEPENTIGLENAKRVIAKGKNRQLADLFQFGFACHHAGMLRSDRNMVEKFFSEGYVKVLVCTSTLAWGVNLPAHAVIIRGTEIYDSKQGSFINLGILDVLQIFGRAGRPQFDKSGTGIIITSHDKLSHYLSLLTNQFPIESNFISCLADNLNAEVCLGTIANVEEAIEWLSYTYLFVRMKINPLVYGLNYGDIQEDPTLEKKRRDLIKSSAMALDKACMIRFSERTGDLNITDLGRTASYFYIKYDTVEVFNDMMKPIMGEGDVLTMISHAQEFQQLKVRDDELTELDQLSSDNCEVSVGGGTENLHGKVNILIQTYLSRGNVKSFSLISDLSYISQNAVRITRALFDIVLRRNNPVMAGRFLILSKMLELQQWDSESPMRQFRILPFGIIEKIEARNMSVEDIREMDVKELAQVLRNPNMAGNVKRCAEEFPLLEMEASLHPITRTILKIKLQISPNFRWNDRVHGKTSEAFWIWIEDPESNFMYHSEHFLITRKQVYSREPQELIITIPLTEPLPPQYYVRATSDRWLGSQTYLPLSFQHLILPESHPPHTDLLELQPLPVTALKDPIFENLYSFTHFNPIQTQIFHCLYHTDNNVLLGAPTGSGKTIAAEIAMFRVFKQYPKCKVVYIAPLKALVRERMNDWKVRLEKKIGKKVVELTGDTSPDIRAIKESHVIVTTPEKWDGISRSWQTRNYVKDVALIVIDEIHLLGEDRGPVLEVIVSRTNFIASHTARTLRIVGLSTALANAKDLANWLGIGAMGLYNFRPSVRPVPLEVHISGHAGRHYCPRMLSMNKPTFQAIRQHSPNSPALVFVSSRRQTRLTALDLIAYLASEDNPKQFLHIREEEMEQILLNVKEANLKLTLAFGIGIHHAGLQDRDRKTVEELFVNQKIQILICTATLAWGVNFPAHLVVVKGTEYYDGKQKRYVDMPITDVLQMMGRAGRPQFDNQGVAVVLVHDIKKNFYKKFLYEPFPVESSILDVLPDHVNAEIVAGTVQSKQDLLDYLTWTYFFRRLLQNPSYYNLETLEVQDVNKFLSNLIQKALDTLAEASCIEIQEDGRTINGTWMGRISSYYYLSHRTMRHFTENLKSELSIDELLRVLSDAHEYNELPVRHNEDLMNGELSKLCRVPVDPLTLDSSHTKTFLLLQAHFSHLHLPCTDYLTDLKSVLDQAIRILQATIDTCAEQGWLVSTLHTQQIMQMVIQARWIEESPLLTLPHVESHHLYLFSLMSRALNRPCMFPAGLKAACFREYEALATHLRQEFDDSQIEQIYKVICDWPTLNVKLSIRGSWSESPMEQNKIISQPPSREGWMKVHAGQDYTLIVELHRQGGKTNAVHCPRFPRGKDESWFLTLGSVEHKELLALKRASVRGAKSSQQINFFTPFNTGRTILTLYVLSDCYLGLDQQYNIQLDVCAPMEQNVSED
ncbi:activating signal cointegrator 1 complex subunit obelus [Arctopsyche grandis]|uniref:activating signal cointegrator 1 complex subunit obelus n=1 Tax=Arctopsyche grandis TaxID=121162 RepID=UPI00406D69E9